MRFLDELAARRRFGMRPGLDAMRRMCRAMGDPQERVRAIHVAGTNGKGAVCAILDSCLRAGGCTVGRYTSPHLVSLNERFFIGGEPVSDDVLEASARRVAGIPESGSLTYFEALTAVAFDIYASAALDYVILETGLGGRLDATNVCRPSLSVITRIGLDHCEWLGGTVREIALEKAGIMRPSVPVVIGANEGEALDVLRRHAEETMSRVVYAPDEVDEGEIPADFSLGGAFNRENAVTALAALKTIGAETRAVAGMSSVVWPGRFQRVGRFIVDGAHNPPAARALAASLSEEIGGRPRRSCDLIAGFCGDKDVDEVLRTLSPLVRRGYAVKTNNPRSLAAPAVAAKMKDAGIDAVTCDSLREAMEAAGPVPVVICGSLFLAGEALVELGAYPWGRSPRYDPAESLRSS